MSHVLPKRLVVFTIRSQPIPKVKDDEAIEIRTYNEGFYGVTALHGFIEEPDISRFLNLCTKKGLALDPNEVFFYLSRMTIMTTGRSRLAPWRKLLFAFMYHNARPMTSFYNLPPNRVVELGRLIEL